MKKILILVCILFSMSLSYAEEVVFATGEWAPYTSESMSEYGYATELITAICKEAGITPIYKFYPWARAEITVESGDSFAAFPYVTNDERKAKYNFSDAIYYGETVYMYYSDNEKITEKVKISKTLDEMKGLDFGIVLGHFAKKDLTEKGIKYAETVKIIQLIMMLRLKRIDMIIGNKTVLYDEIQKKFPAEIDKFDYLASTYGQKTANVLIVSKKYKNGDDLLKRFNEGLKKIKANGIYDKIIKKNKMSGI